MSLKNKYRVDNVPTFLKPIFWIYGTLLGSLLYFYLWLCHRTCLIEIKSQKMLNGGQPAIYCIWHNLWPVGFAAQLKFQKHIWLNHPAWYMKPIHVALSLMEVERVILGSTGHEGKQAADELAKVLKEGYSTVFMPDGPAGPPRVLRKGVLHVSQQTGIPIVPIRVVAERCYQMNSWDKRLIPIPFVSKIHLTLGEPIQVTPENFETSAKQLTEQLG